MKDLEAFYGLPKQVLFCKECVISNQRPNSTVEFKSSAEEKKKVIAAMEDQKFMDEFVFSVIKEMQTRADALQQDRSLNTVEANEEKKRLRQVIIEQIRNCSPSRVVFCPNKQPRPCSAKLRRS